MSKNKESLSLEELKQKAEEARQRNKENTSAQKKEKQEREDKNEKARKLAQKAAIKRSKKSFWKEYYEYILTGVGCIIFVLVMNFTPDRKLRTGLSASDTPVIDDNLIYYHNESESEYTLGPNKMFEGVAQTDLELLFSNTITVKPTLPKCPATKSTEPLPDSFNFKTKFTTCSGPVYTQGLCSSSWAISSVSMFNDRLCQIRNGQNGFKASVQQILSCDTKTSQGCTKGSIMSALEYGRTKGFISEECMPYDYNNIPKECNYSTINKCEEKEFASDYCAVEGIEAIKREIFENGPVASVIPIFNDFLVYKEGVYNPKDSATRIDGNHAVKIVGWDNDGKTEYWIVENSFGEDWGVSGTINIKIGLEDSQLDKVGVVVYPKVEVKKSESE